MNVLSLFSGAGLMELGLERVGMTTVGQVERDAYCLKLLAHHFPGVPQHDDVTTAADWWLGANRPEVDVVCGGFPCWTAPAWPVTRSSRRSQNTSAD